MRDLVHISEEELQELTTRQRLRLILAMGISAGCGIVSLQGMAALFTDARVVPLPGMNQLPGQIAWAVALTGMLVAVTFLVRGVIKRRLQWGIALSLLIHLLLCLSMTTVEYRSPLETRAAAADLAGLKREEFTLPDYAGEEVPNSDAVWMQPVTTQTPDNEVNVERQEMKLATIERPEPVVTEQQTAIERLDPDEIPERKEQVTLANDRPAEIERRETDNSHTEVTTLETPHVSTAESRQPDFQAEVEQSKTASDLPMIEAETSDADSAVSVELEAAKIAAQLADSTPIPEAVETTAVRKSSAMAKNVAAESEANESVAVSTSAARQSELAERKVEVARQKAASTSRSGKEASLSNASSSIGGSEIRGSKVERASVNGEAGAESPSSGGRIALSRRQSAGAAGGAAAAAEAVSVGATAKAGSSMLSESSAAKATSRRITSSSIPAGSGGEGASVMASTSHSNGTIRNAVISKSSNGGGSPEISDSGSAISMTGRRQGTAANAVGSTASDVTVASVGSGSGRAGNSLVSGPAGTSVARQTANLPSSQDTQGTGSSTGSGGREDDTGNPGGSSGQPTRSSVAMSRGRGTEPDASLGSDAGFARGTKTGVSLSKTVPSIGVLPVGAAKAEQSGTLVFAGPQSTVSDATASGPVGPRIARTPRRSAGLPGSSGPSNAAPSSVTASVQPGRVVTNGTRSSVGDSQPTIASADAISGLIRKSASGLAASPEARIAENLSMRNGASRREAAVTLGGSTASEEAVERGLAWLAQTQYPDGHWRINEFEGDTLPPAKSDEQSTSFKSHSAATGLALLAYLGAGYTHQDGKYADVVKAGMKWLLDRQKPNGDLFADETEFVRFYSHGIASIALCEAYGLTKDPALKESAQRALNFIIDSQHPEFGGWRYVARFESDTSVSGWQLMALKSGEMSGLTVPKDAYSKVGKWLDTVQSKTAAGQFSYHPRFKVSSAMTAEGLLMRQYLGMKRNDPQLIAGANFLRTRLPDPGQRDSYYWYYATQVMFHMQGEHWSEWNAALRDMLVSSQAKEGTASGSWDPFRPTPEKWGVAGGRHYLTCLNLLMLEVYYRHLPLYLELEK